MEKEKLRLFFYLRVLAIGNFSDLGLLNPKEQDINVLL